MSYLHSHLPLYAAWYQRLLASTSCPQQSEFYSFFLAFFHLSLHAADKESIQFELVERQTREYWRFTVELKPIPDSFQSSHTPDPTWAANLESIISSLLSTDANRQLYILAEQLLSSHSTHLPSSFSCDLPGIRLFWEQILPIGLEIFEDLAETDQKS